ncbi:MAG: hypothetical protein H3Z53_11045 [archaeon]|nr:hypothetical protein [archaeon]MCP8314888.1 hypothetical protein [archaeon]
MGTALKGTLQYMIFVVFFSIWFILLLTVYLPISKLVTPIFPLPTVYDYMPVIFLVSAILSALTSFYIGVDKLITNPKRLEKGSN